jgi:hypothetical protein
VIALVGINGRKLVVISTAEQHLLHHAIGVIPVPLRELRPKLVVR